MGRAPRIGGWGQEVPHGRRRILTEQRIGATSSRPAFFSLRLREKRQTRWRSQKQPRQGAAPAKSTANTTRGTGQRAAGAAVAPTTATAAPSVHAIQAASSPRRHRSSAVGSSFTTATSILDQRSAKDTFTGGVHL